METKTIISNILAGVLIAVINVTVAISVAALMFTETRPEFLAPGIVVLLIGTVVIGLGGTLFSHFHGVICAPRSGLAPVFAAIVGGVYTLLKGTPEALPTMLMAIMVTSFITGVFLILLGQLRLGNLVRYIPYPVMGGFFAGIGYIFVRGGLTVAMGTAPSLDIAGDAHLMTLALPAVAFAAGLYVVQTEFDHWSTFPIVLLIAFALFYLVFGATGQNFETAAAEGWLPVIADTPGVLFPVIRLDDVAMVNWSVILQQSGGILVVALLSAIFLLLDTSGIEIITRRELNPDRELRLMGAANIVSGIAGGYPGVHVASDTAFTFKLGGDRQLMGFVYAGVVVLTIMAGTGFIARVPTFVLGGLLIYVGLDFLIDWVWKTRREFPIADYAIVLVILGAIATVGILQGVAFGFAVAIVLFVINYSQLSVIKAEATGRDHASNVDRDLATRQRLNEEGNRILILTLQGFIFFGTADKLITEIREKIENGQSGPHFLVLDFHHVSQLDTSAIRTFAKLVQLSEKHGFHIVITGANDHAIEHLQRIDFFDTGVSPWRHVQFDQKDDGVAWCEDMILGELNLVSRGVSRAAYELLVMITEDESSALDLAPYFVEEQKSAGEHLFHQGEPGDSLYLVGTGSVAVVIGTGDGQHVLRRYRSGAILGEMALYTGETRSASVIIEEDATLYRLDADQLASMQQTHPDAVGRLHRYIVRVLSERLNRANRELQHYL